jgi:hypothetical protein
VRKSGARRSGEDWYGELAPCCIVYFVDIEEEEIRCYYGKGLVTVSTARVVESGLSPGVKAGLSKVFSISSPARPDPVDVIR